MQNNTWWGERIDWRKSERNSYIGDTFTWNQNRQEKWRTFYGVIHENENESSPPED